jgi:hypothetical protein
MSPSVSAECRGTPRDGNTENPGLAGGKNTGPRPKSQQSGPGRGQKHQAKTKITAIRAWTKRRGASQDGNTGNPGLAGGKNTRPRPKSQQSGPRQSAGEPPRTGRTDWRAPRPKQTKKSIGGAEPKETKKLCNPFFRALAQVAEPANFAADGTIHPKNLDYENTP